MSVRASIFALMFPIFYAHAEVPTVYFGTFQATKESSRRCGGNLPWYSVENHVREVTESRRCMREIADEDLHLRLTAALPPSAQILSETFGPRTTPGSPYWSYTRQTNRWGERPHVDHLESQRYDLEALVLSDTHSQLTHDRLSGIYLELSADGLHSDFQLVLGPEALDVKKAGALRVRLNEDVAARVRARVARGGIEYARLMFKNQIGVSTAGNLYRVEEIAEFLGLRWTTRLRGWLSHSCGYALFKSAGN